MGFIWIDGIIYTQGKEFLSRENLGPEIILLLVRLVHSLFDWILLQRCKSLWLYQM